MLETMHLESINIGQIETISRAQQSHTTGICKYAVKGGVYLDEAGLRGDAVVDQLHHGGVDQAVYAYSADDYDWWTRAMGLKVAAGLFGDNLTIRGLPSDMNVGDRLLIGEVVLEATAPRIPCGTIATRMQDPEFGIAFRQAERPGIYFRVLSGGEVFAGDSVTLVVNDSSDVSILELFRFYYALRHDKATLRRFLKAPLAIRFRAKVEAKLAALEQASG